MFGKETMFLFVDAELVERTFRKPLYTALGLSGFGLIRCIRKPNVYQQRARTLERATWLAQGEWHAGVIMLVSFGSPRRGVNFN